MERTKNALLFVIALCLVLIVLRLYSSGDLVSAAQAQPSVGETHIFGWQCNGADCGWRHVNLNAAGALMIAPK